ncbi:hypothetical protein GUITHDRAFT_101392 [Guillardia theta CCMP2712]|uniref:Uncharacterized protein n=1 Tax=Guillardia theta (strain CCMP2712) TaxID=905079 RepID=L1JXJ9_GUITC|nr:hypothetical protein GUITHDRAFT_101392 [Guillardia theta CCMP2712]EKX52940.1 hypothetical protein GUITHDRAFT_101392 [Guillardia theta CCMP2712]|eukprot:XP_005839920.1 hypothetical protein GUITHDRAFT_101392 [Guillardia theta CCMP2712]
MDQAGKGARGLILKWALLKAFGPDRWHFAALMNEERTTAIKEAITRHVGETRAIQRAGADGSIAVADLGAGHGLYGMMAERGGAG